MTSADLEALRRKLEERARRIVADSNVAVEEAREAPAVRNDVMDVGEESVLDELIATRADFSERDRRLLVEIRDALQRVRDGSYGRCIDCGQEIDAKRLQAVPWARRCADDQEQHEQEMRETRPRL